MAFVRPTKRYVGEITYRGGVPASVNKHEILPTLPKECGFIEPQDFRAGDGELVYSCMGPFARGDFTISVMGTNLVFQRGDSSGGEVGEGYGLYLLRLPD